MAMITIPGGSFTLGANRAGRAGVVVNVDAFQLSNTAVSLSEWQALVSEANAAGYQIPTVDSETGGPVGFADGPNHPVQGVSLLDAAAACNAQSERAGRTPLYLRPNDAVYRGGHGVARIKLADVSGLPPSRRPFRLPLEKEWEWAAREAGALAGDWIGGSSNHYYAWPHSFVQAENPHDRLVWSNGEPRTVRVDAGSPNALGIYHMVGNTWEWVQHLVRDASGEYADDSPSDAYCVVRGGSVFDRSELTRPNTRDVSNVRFRLRGLGFRVAR